MKSRCNKAFSLLEALIATAVVSATVILIFRSFAAALSSARLSLNMSMANYLAADKLWEIEEACAVKGGILPGPTSAKIAGTDFDCGYEIADIDGSFADLKRLKLVISWRESMRLGDYSVDFLTYLRPRQ
ncbi:MAG: hypothetical protein PHE18_02270 [Candidatus Omnitrophica bacterium]|nr:hypothetical protein [Candidatus Omnitrophota bacterium]MDD5552678.1 hypothetical protein [Candidatus Omnitrophota bacterium]